MVLKIRNKRIKVKPMLGINAYLGLMFWQRGNVLLPNGPIHTFFCNRMKLIYIKNGKIKKIIDAKPWRTFDKIDADYILETTEDIKVRMGDRVHGLPKNAKRKTRKRNRRR